VRGASSIWFARPVAPLYALYCLAFARIRFGKSSSDEIFRSLPGRKRKKLGRKPTSEELERMRWAIAAVAAKVPWRADCLIQVLAADRWLCAFDIAAQAHVGVRDHDGELAAHSWMTADGVVVTGSRDIGAYHVLRLAADSSPAP
jgi:hypothetical protein